MWTWIAGVAVACLVGLAIYGVVNNKRKQKSCGSSCDSCSRGQVSRESCKDR